MVVVVVVVVGHYFQKSSVTSKILQYPSSLEDQWEFLGYDWLTANLKVAVRSNFQFAFFLLK